MARLSRHAKSRTDMEILTARTIAFFVAETENSSRMKTLLIALRTRIS
jgi:hypothetical protein